jgi:hypothetical protein
MSHAGFAAGDLPRKEIFAGLKRDVASHKRGQIPLSRGFCVLQRSAGSATVRRALPLKSRRRVVSSPEWPSTAIWPKNWEPSSGQVLARGGIAWNFTSRTGGCQILDDPNYTEKRTDVLSVRARQAFFEYLLITQQAHEDGRIYWKVSYGPLLDVFVLDMPTYRNANGPDNQTSDQQGTLGEPSG